MPEKHSEEDLPVLAEMVREAERVFDLQLQSFESLDAKSERSVALALAALGGLLALSTVSIDKLPTAFAFSSWLLLSTAGGLNLLALVFFVDAYIGFRPARMRIGVVPNLDWVASKSAEGDWTLVDHYRSMLAAYPMVNRHNQRIIDTRIGRRRLGLVMLLLAMALAAFAYAYIVWRMVA